MGLAKRWSSQKESCWLPMGSYSDSLDCVGFLVRAAHQNQPGSFCHGPHAQANPGASNSISLKQAPGIFFFSCRYFCHISKVENHWAKKRGWSGPHLRLPSKSLLHVLCLYFLRRINLGKNYSLQRNSPHSHWSMTYPRNWQVNHLKNRGPLSKLAIRQNSVAGRGRHFHICLLPNTPVSLIGTGKD